MGNKQRSHDEYEQFSCPERFPYKIDMALSGTLRKDGNSSELGSRVTLRRFAMSDRQFIGRLCRDVFKIYGPYEDILPGWLKSGNDIAAIVACQDQRQIGFAMLSKPSEIYDLQDASELLGIAVEPERQGKGVGELLLRTIESKSRFLNIKWVFLHTAIDNMPARRLYEKAGYRSLEIKKCFYPKGQDAIVMYKAVKRIC